MHIVKGKSFWGRWWWAIATGAVLLLGFLGMLVWYVWALAPPSADGTFKMVTIEQGLTPSGIGDMLEEQDMIRSSAAFQIYTSISGVSGKLQAGRYKLSPSMSVSDIVGHLVNGENDTYTVTILPGMTLKQLADPNADGNLVTQGFTPKEIAEAFAAAYSSPLFDSRPAGASLEGYIFPETYNISPNDTLQSLLQRSFDELYKKIVADNLIAQLSARGMTLHQAVTLASIVQEEDDTIDVQPQIAQVFLLRLQRGMNLGSDATYTYAAHQLGVPANPDLDSPYNTRKHPGLPPGPVSTLNYSALKAVAQPAAGDYLYFVHGDDGTAYFSHTLEEHEALTRQHCTTLCR